MNSRVKIGRIYLTNISVQMDQVIVQTDFPLTKEFPTFQAIRQFITVISKTLFLHQSCAGWIQSTLFCLISIQTSFKLFSHLRQYITHGLFIHIYSQNPLSIASLSYMCQLHPLITLFLFLSPKNYLPKTESHQALHYVIFSSHLPPNSWSNVLLQHPISLNSHNIFFL